MRCWKTDWSSGGYWRMKFSGRGRRRKLELMLWRLTLPSGCPGRQRKVRPVYDTGSIAGALAGKCFRASVTAVDAPREFCNGIGTLSLIAVRALSVEQPARGFRFPCAAASAGHCAFSVSPGHAVEHLDECIICLTVPPGMPSVWSRVRRKGGLSPRTCVDPGPELGAGPSCRWTTLPASRF
jgi:hypothetical protein